MSSPNSVATAILANTTTDGQDIDRSYYDAIGGIETPLTGGSLLSVSIGNVTDSMASSMISPRNSGGGHWDRYNNDSPTTGASTGPAGAQQPSWLHSDDNYSDPGSELDTRPFPSMDFSRTTSVVSGSIAPDSSFYSQLNRFQRVRNSVLLAQPWRRRKDSTTTGSYATTTDDEDGNGDDDDVSTISGSCHDLRQRQAQYEQERNPWEDGPGQRGGEEEDDATTPPVDLFSQHQFIMPKPDETTPLIAGDVENLCSSGGASDGLSPSSARQRRSRIVLRLMLVVLAGMVAVGILLVVKFGARAPVSGERTED